MPINKVFTSEEGFKQNFNELSSKMIKSSNIISDLFKSNPIRTPNEMEPTYISSPNDN